MNSYRPARDTLRLRVRGATTRRCRAAALTFAVVVALATGSGPAPATDQGHLIGGTVRIAENVDEQSRSANTGPDVRLIIRLYHPDEGIEKDETFRIYNNANFPVSFEAGPGLDMSRRTKWTAYVVEAYTDLDGDITTLGANELRASSIDLVPTGTRGIELLLVPKE